MEKKKLKISSLKVQSFVTEFDKKGKQTYEMQGGFTGNCGSVIRITCPGDCDFPSIPIDECTFGGCTRLSDCICNTEMYTICNSPCPV